ncbi:hypothetical protein KL910_000470 [Ogataea haglerorum]|nr:hypothetical protein KL945_004816 [Ogataea haglerorum]KAG7793775.1 hypothetical protein KL910_000470 [Ogataea haglerorum]
MHGEGANEELRKVARADVAVELGHSCEQDRDVELFSMPPPRVSCHPEHCQGCYATSKKSQRQIRIVCEHPFGAKNNVLDRVAVVVGQHLAGPLPHRVAFQAFEKVVLGSDHPAQRHVVERHAYEVAKDLRKEDEFGRNVVVNANFLVLENVLGAVPAVPCNGAVESRSTGVFAACVGEKRRLHQQTVHQLVDRADLDLEVGDRIQVCHRDHND